MPNFLLAYLGGGTPEAADDQEAVMTAWMNWFGQLGDAIVDGGAPFGPSASVRADQKAGSAGSGLSGYSIISAASLDEACEKARGCPVLSSGGSIDVYETTPIG